MTQDMKELERDIEESRARLDLTIDRLQDKLSVSGIVDDLLGTARKNSYGPFYDNALTVIKRNPVPVMLAAAGIGWLLYRMGQDTMRRNRRMTSHLTYVDPVDAPVLHPADTGIGGIYDSTAPIQSNVGTPELRRELGARA
jgi:hypothetical protein